MTAYYNEFKPEAAHMLRQLIKDGLIAPGDVDERSITEVTADDIRNYTQCHFFAGIGLWSVALRLARWDDSRPVWTGSCPCQPFSSAGRQKGKADERHLWPEWFRLIRECRPGTIFGEQVESAIAHGWLDDVYNDMEGQGYAVGAAVLPACAVGKPHQRKRLWFVAQSTSERDSGAVWAGSGTIERPQSNHGNESGGASNGSTLGNAEHNGQFAEQELRGDESAGNKWRKEESQLSGQSEGAGRPANVPSIQRCESGSESSVMANTSHLVGDERMRGNDSVEGRRNEGAIRADGGVLDVADSECAGLQGHGGYVGQYGEAGRQEQDGHAGEDNFQWIECPDGKSRPIEPRISLLVDGYQHRAPILHAIGNAIVPQVAAEFIKATM